MGDEGNGVHDQAYRDDRGGDRRDSRRGDRDRDRDRDRSRDRKHRRRSRSRSRDRKSRRRSRSRSRSRRRSRSPSIPPQERPRRRKTFFDVLPPGGIPENAGGMGAAAAALQGAPLPIAAAAAAAISATNPLAAASLGLTGPNAKAAQAQITRHARRVYIGGLPSSATDVGLDEFFRNALAAVGGTIEPGNPIEKVYCNWEKKFAFIEFRSVEETSNSLALDGIMYDGVNIRIRRPSDYNPTAAIGQGPTHPNPNLNLAAIGMHTAAAAQPVLPVPTTNAPEDQHRVFVGGLPYYLTEEQCRELLGAFGVIKTFDLVKDKETGQSKGYGFVVYEDPSVAEIACMGLHGTKMGDRTLTTGKGDGGVAAGTATKVVCLDHAVVEDELRDDEEYEEIMEDMKEECGKYGAVTKVVIPRPPKQEGEPRASGVGRVFIEFSMLTSAAAARSAMHGRKFGGRVVEAKFYGEDKLVSGELDE